MANSSTVFISYSWDDDSHIQWVEALAARLRSDGIETILDRWEVAVGEHFTHFMERSIARSDYVLLVCTPTYRLKSENRMGGVGYEGNIMTAELCDSQNHSKFIPIIAKGTRAESVPTWRKGARDLDLSDPARFEDGYRQLLAALLGQRPGAPLPEPSTRDTRQIADPPIPPDLSPALPVRILDIIVDEVGEPPMDGTPGCGLYSVPLKLNRHPSEYWAQAFLAAWRHPRRSTSRHRPENIEVCADRIILTRTTMEEILDNHRETLSLCIQDANAEEARHLARQAAEQAAARERSDEHRRNAKDVASRIWFDQDGANA